MPSATILRVSWMRACTAGVLALSMYLGVPAILGAGQAPADTGEAAEARSVWDGVFTAEQAARGRSHYAEHCSGCHGASLQGGEHRALAGDRFWTSWQDTTVDRLLTYVSTSMPHSEDGSLQGALGTGVYADIVAHILSTNAFPAGADVLTPDSIAGVHIVRRDGPSELPAGSFVHVVGCLARGPNRDWQLLRASAPARVLSGESDNLDAPLGDREYALLFVITPLDRFVGHRMSVRASLVGEGGAEGLNVTTITSIGDTCE
jgi:S-disulfanyl-L-cysteine oxidoreductase SoxD